MKPMAERGNQGRSATVADSESLFWEQGLRTRMAASGLSKREQEITLLAIRGLSNREIAGCLYICEQTVKDHLYTTFSKLTIHRRSQLATKLCGLSTESHAPQFLLS
jgi:DNA-binding NarL/FixJ family response regulator